MNVTDFSKYNSKPQAKYLENPIWVWKDMPKIGTAPDDHVKQVLNYSE